MHLPKAASFGACLESHLCRGHVLLSSPKWKEPAGYLRTTKTASWGIKKRSCLCEAVFLVKGAKSSLDGTPPPPLRRLYIVFFQYILLLKKNPESNTIKKAKFSIALCERSGWSVAGGRPALCEANSFSHERLLRSNKCGKLGAACRDFP